MKWAAAKTSALLVALFLVIYGSCNSISAHRSDVGAWAYGWERYIPFVPLMIVPYMSIDLFFVAGPFLCTSRHELRLLARRIAVAILIAGAFFLAMPLRCTFERTPVEGWLGLIFNSFRALDAPYNQLPSLHIALRTFLADLYARHTKGVTRIASNVWFSLIGASTLLTHQHQVIDVIGGFALAAVCFYALSPASWRWPVTRNRPVGGYYAVGALLLTFIALLTRPWGAILLWPALSLAVVSLGYFGLGPGIYRKHDGRLAFAARLLLAPVLLGQWLSLQHYSRKSRRWDAINEHLWIGRVLKPSEAQQAVEQGVTAVLDLTCEFTAPPPFRKLGYLNLPVLDLTAPTPEQLQQACDFLAAHGDGIVYVHCKAGYSRSAAVVAAHLVRCGASACCDDAVTIIRNARPNIVMRGEALRAAQAFCDGCERENDPPMPANSHA